MDLTKMNLWRRTSVLFLAVVLAAAPLMSLRQALVMAPLVGLAALLSLLASGGFNGPFRLHLRSVCPLLLLVFWAGLSCLWSIDPGASQSALVMLIAAAAAGLALIMGLQRMERSSLHFVAGAFAAGLAAAIASLLATDLAVRLGIFPQWVTRLYAMDRATTVIAVTAWPAAAWLARLGRPRLAILLIVSCLVAVGLAFDLAAKLAAGAGIVGYGLALRRPGIAVRALTIAAALGCLAAPFAARQLPPPGVTATWAAWSGGLPASAHHRLTIWSFTGQRMLDHPWLGSGIDTARSQPGGRDEAHVTVVSECPQATTARVTGPVGTAVPEGCVGRTLNEEQLPLHPHDWWLQLWLELGPVGAGLMAILLLGLGRRIAIAPNKTGQAVAVATLATALVVCSISFGVWQSWWVCTLWLALGLSSPLLTWQD